MKRHTSLARSVGQFASGTISIGIIFLLTNFTATQASAEIAQCNDPQVKETLVRRFVEFRTAMVAFLSPIRRVDTDAAIAILRGLDTDVVNIRQQHYDQHSDVRYCAGTLMNRGMPALTPHETSAYASVLLSAIISSGHRNPDDCGDDRGGTTYYKIERILDKPGHVYVSWRCEPW